MPSFAESLEATLHNALKHAADRAHEYATLEHLLLALIDDDEAARVMQACGVDVGELSDIITTYLDNELESLRVEGKVDPSPTSGFQRVVRHPACAIIWQRCRHRRQCAGGAVFRT